MDSDHALVVFPPEIYITTSRPDMVVWSVALKRVFLMELTAGMEEGMEAAQMRKKARYASLLSDINATVWSASLFTVEVGARGFVGHSLRRCLRLFGFKPKATKDLCRSVSLIAAKCSHAVLLARKNAVWDKHRVLLSTDMWQPRPQHAIRVVSELPNPAGEAPRVRVPGETLGPELEFPCDEEDGKEERAVN